MGREAAGDEADGRGGQRGDEDGERRRVQGDAEEEDARQDEQRRAERMLHVRLAVL